jgi:quercetin dioxygenase-like cupin family protein
VRIFNPHDEVWTPEPAYNTVARRFFPWDGLVPPGWGGAWVAVLPGETSTAHAHDEHEIFFVVSGEGKLVHGTETHQARAGTSAHMEPGVEHSLVNTGTEDLVFLSVWWDQVPDAEAPEPVVP